MTLFTILLIIAVCSYCAFLTTGKVIKSNTGNVLSLFHCFCVGVCSVLTALPLALIARLLYPTVDLLLSHAALIGLLAGEVAFFLRARLNPPGRSS